MTEKQKKVVAKQVRKLEEVYALHEKDREVLHICADEVLLEALVELGFSEIVLAYEKIREDADGFWHA